MPTLQAPTSTESITLPISGMSCAACQSHVEKALAQTPGVTSATVNLLHHTARVIYHPETTTPRQLVEAVQNSGYQATLPAPLTSETPTQAAPETNPNQLRTRAIVILAMAAAAMLLSLPLMPAMGPVSMALARFLPALYQLPTPLLSYTLLAFTVIGMALSKSEVYAPAWSAARHRTTNMNTLVALGTIAAAAYSATATIAPQVFLSRHIHPDIYYESVLFILGFLLMGRWLEARAKLRTQSALQAFQDLQPQTARILLGGQETQVPLAHVQPGDILVLRPGERVPVDGILLTGTTSIDESLITGESAPVLRNPGDPLIGGSLNYDGAIEYRATAPGSGGVLAQMLRLMEQAQSSRAPTQQLADRVSGVFVPIVLGLAALTFVAWAALDPADLAHAFASAVTVLVIACPCALGLAVPAALTVAIGRGAQLGILFKSGEAIERTAHIDTVALDKTGTLTAGHPEITAIQPESHISATELLRLTASIEQRSEHPLAKAVLKKAAEAHLQLAEPSNIQAIPGKGVTGTVAGQTIAAGNPALFEALGIPPPALPAGDQAVTRLFVTVNGIYSGCLSAQDQLRPGAAQAIARLNHLGLKTILLTGDNQATAESIASQTGIGDYRHSLLPNQKLEAIQALQRSGKKVAMVGDGINDAAALAQADAGLAIGTGTDLAREAGEVILLRGEPASIPAALDLARHTLAVMRQNLGWALAYNLVGIPLAAGVLYPAFGILLSPAIASAAMALSSISVLANSLRLRRYNAK